MPDLNEKLHKSLEEISKLADEILSKSDEVETVEGEGVVEGDDVEKGLKPEDVSSDADAEDDTDKDTEDDEKDDEDVEKSEKTATVTQSSEENKDPNGDDLDEGEDKDPRKGKKASEGEVKKSFAEEIAENEELSKAIDVSDFLAEWSRIQAATIDAMRADINKSLQTSAETATILAKSFNAIMKSQNALAKSIDELRQRLEVVERTPVGRKATVAVVEKSFKHSAGVEGAGELTKSQKLEKLTNMVLQGKPGVTFHDVVAFESTGQLRPEVEAMLTEN